MNLPLNGKKNVILPLLMMSDKIFDGLLIK